MGYKDIQSSLDRAYEAQWHEWYASLSYGERASLRALGLHKAQVEKKQFGGGQEARDEADLQERLPELARHDLTPHEEMARREDAALVDAEQVRQEIWNRHFHLFAMFMGTGVEQFDLLRLRSVIMLKHAAPEVLGRFGLVNGGALKMIKRLRAGLGVVVMHEYVPLCDILNEAGEEDELAGAHELHLDVRAFRLLRFGGFCEEIGKRSRTLDQWAKNAIAWIRRTKPKEIAGLGASQTAVSRKFGEKRATVSAREIRVVEEPLKQAGVRGYHLLGGTKSDSHRQACVKAQQGNTSRAEGERRKREREGRA
jgi:hypothetical protein